MPGTKQPELTIERFSALVEAYGSDLDRFPERERTAAKALALSSRDAQQLLAAARVFDSLLASARDDLPQLALERRLATIPERFVQQRAAIRLLPFRTHARAGLAAAAAVLLGLASGQLGAQPTSFDTGDAHVASADEAVSGTEQADLASFFFGDELFGDSSLDSAQPVRAAGRSGPSSTPANDQGGTE